MLAAFVDVGVGVGFVDWLAAAFVLLVIVCVLLLGLAAVVAVVVVVAQATAAAAAVEATGELWSACSCTAAALAARSGSMFGQLL